MRLHAGSFARAGSLAAISSIGMTTLASADDRGVIIPPGTDPVIHTLVAQLQGDFSGLPPQDDPRFGHSVALHGDTLAVGAPGTLVAAGDPPVIRERGTVFVYQRNPANDTWQFVQRLFFGAGGAGQCGTSVALSDFSLLVGCPFHLGRGRAVFYRRATVDGEFGDPVSFVDASVQTGAECGSSVALIDSAPGTASVLPMAAVGCPNRRDFPQGNLGLVGAVDIYRNLLGQWALAESIAGPGTAFTDFGRSLNLNRAGPSPDMTMLLSVGVPGTGSANGSVRIYEMGATVADWTLDHTMVGPQSGSRFGHSVDMNAGRLAVGAPERRTVLPGSNPIALVANGSVTITTRACTFQGVCNWSATIDEFFAPTFPNGQPFVAQNRLGESVHVLEPARVFAGAPLYPWPNFFGQGRHYVLDDGEWVLNEDEPFYPIGANLPTSEFGAASSGDEAWLAVGAPGYPDADGNHGRVFVYGYDYDDTIFANGFELPLR